MGNSVKYFLKLTEDTTNSLFLFNSVSQSSIEESDAVKVDFPTAQVKVGNFIQMFTRFSHEEMDVFLVLYWGVVEEG